MQRFINHCMIHFKFVVNNILFCVSNNESLQLKIYFENYTNLSKKLDKT